MVEYRVGESLAADDPTYIEREADRTLYRSLVKGELCYVLTSRQMGKSSLRLRTRQRLEADGMGRCAAIDLARIGSQQITPEQWYLGLAFDLQRKFHLSNTLDLTPCTIAADGSPDQAKLQLSGIAIARNGQIQITNPIYAEVFNHDWVNQCLAQQRPYAVMLQAWVASNFQDDSRLLMGQALQDARQWAAHKSLSDLDYRYLSASQAWDAKMVRLELEAKNQANRMLAEAQRKANQIIWLSYLSLGACLAISLVALLSSLFRP